MLRYDYYHVSGLYVTVRNPHNRWQHNAHLCLNMKCLIIRETNSIPRKNSTEQKAYSKVESSYAYISTHYYIMYNKFRIHQKLPCCIKLAFQIISWRRYTVKQPSRRKYYLKLLCIFHHKLQIKHTVEIHPSTVLNLWKFGSHTEGH